jgi:hypothetical protein
MKNNKTKYLLLFAAFLFIVSIILLNIQKKPENFNCKPAYINATNSNDPSSALQKTPAKQESLEAIKNIPEAKDDNMMALLLTALSGLKDEMGAEAADKEKNQNIKKNPFANLMSTKLIKLINQVSGEFEDLPLHTWLPIKFTDREKEEYTANLEKILVYSLRVKTNPDSIEDKTILSNLVSGVLKERIDYLKTACADTGQRSLHRNEEDQKAIDDNFNECNKFLQQLEDRLYYYENEYY